METGEEKAAVNGWKAPVANVCVWPCRLLLHWTKMAAAPVVGFDSVPDFSTPTASRTGIVRKSRIQSLITFIPSRAGRSTARRAVGRVKGGGSLAGRSCSPKRSEGPTVQTHRLTHTHTHTPKHCWDVVYSKLLNPSCGSHSRYQQQPSSKQQSKHVSQLSPPDPAQLTSINCSPTSPNSFVLVLQEVSVPPSSRQDDIIPANC